MKTKIILLFVTILYIASFKIKGQIVYTDMQDTTVYLPNVFVDSVNVLKIDLNNDQVLDIQLMANKINHIYGNLVTGFSHKTARLNSNFLTGLCLNGTNFTLNAGDTINENNQWTIFVYFNLNISNTPWHCYTPVSDSYIGVQFYINSFIHYGWIRCSATDSSITLMDYAYNTQPGMFILAGQINLSIMQNTIDANTNVSVQNRILNIKFNAPVSRTITLFNNSGQKMYSTYFTGSSFVLNMENWSAGIYFVKIDSAKGSTGYKILLLQ